MSSFTLVSVDVDTAQKLSEFIGAILVGPAKEAFISECQKLIESTASEDRSAASLATTQLVNKFLSHQEAVFNLDADGDIEGYFQALASIVAQSSSSSENNMQENLPIVQKSVEVLTSKTDSKPKLRLRILATLFNMSFSGQAKHHVMSAMLKYAVATQQTSQVMSYHTRISDWAAEWALPLVDKRALYLLVSDVLEAGKETSLALSFFVLYISTFGKDAALPVDAHALAIVAVKSAIKSPVPSFTDRSTLLESFTKQQSTGALGSLVDLLSIVCSGSLASYRAYEASNKALMAEHGISADETLTKMRLLTLCSLGVQEQSLTYAKIAEALECSVAEVESWVVDAIAAGLLEASMDQFNSLVTVTRCAHRSFGLVHWQSAKNKLVELQKRVSLILGSISSGVAQE